MPNLIRPHQYGKQLKEEVIFGGHCLKIGDIVYSLFTRYKYKTKNIKIETLTFLT
jgi:hypothetical protein